MDWRIAGGVAGVGGAAALIYWLATQQHPAPPIATNNRGTSLGPGKFLLPNQYLRSANGAYTLVLQTDGNLVLYADASVSGTTWKGNVLWSTGTNGKTVKIAVVQTDSNFVLYDSTLQVAGAWKGNPQWASNTQDRSGGLSGATLVLQNNGDVEIMVQGQPIWSTNTSQSASAVQNAINGAVSAAQNVVGTVTGTANSAENAVGAVSSTAGNAVSSLSNAGSSINNLLPGGGGGGSPDDGGDSSS